MLGNPVSHLGSVYLSSLLLWQIPKLIALTGRINICFGSWFQSVQPMDAWPCCLWPYGTSRQEEALVYWKYLISWRQESKTVTGRHLRVLLSSARAILPSTKFHPLRFWCLKQGHKLSTKTKPTAHVPFGIIKDLNQDSLWPWNTGSLNTFLALSGELQMQYMTYLHCILLSNNTLPIATIQD